jgi:hypothetical protein
VCRGTFAIEQPRRSQEEAPEQIDAMRAPRAAARCSARISACGTGREMSSMPGDPIVSARASSRRPYGTSSWKLLVSTFDAIPHTRTR